MELDQIMQMAQEYADAHDGENPFRNYAWREIGVVKVQQPFISGLRRFKYGKYDATDDYGKYWEVKSTTVRGKTRDGRWSAGACQFQFDKQDEDLRRVETLESDAFIFALFYELSLYPEFCIRVDNHSAVHRVKELIKIKQARFLLTVDRRRAEHKRYRDNINVSLRDLLSALSPVDYVITNKEGEVISLSQFLNEVYIGQSRRTRTA